MDAIFFYSAIIGGSFLVIQTILSVIGIGAESLDVGDAGGSAEAVDFDADAAHSMFVHVLSIRALVAFFTFFGLGGLAGNAAGLDPRSTVFVAIGGGLASMLIVAYVMNLLVGLHSSGSLDMSNAIGKTGRVYLRVPAEKKGQGKVHVVVQGRTVEARAVTSGPELATGSAARVVALVDAGTLEVTSAEEKS